MQQPSGTPVEIEFDPRAGGARWHPQAAIAGSIGLHMAAPAGVIVAPETWPWALAALAANHVLLGIAGLCPRSRILGPNLTRLPDAAAQRMEMALTFDDGPDPDVTPQVLDLLDAHAARATFLCIGEAAARHPALCREIARRGHGVENHSYRHLAGFAMLGPRGMRDEIGRAQAILTELCGRAPQFFRPPAGLRNPLLDPVLHEAGLRLVSWTRRGFDTRISDARWVAARLLDGLAAADILLLHDGHAARTSSGSPVVLHALPHVLQRVKSQGLRAVALHEAVHS